jgi:Ca2+-binding RTX toxin-like protein
MGRLWGVILAIGVFLVFAAPAAATVTRITAGGTQIELESDAASDNISLACVGGMAQSEGVNLLACNAVHTLFIVGNGGNDSINLSNISGTDFPQLSRIEINGGTGTDTVTGTQLADTITADELDNVNGGPGDDSIEGGGQVAGGEGDDMIEHSAGPVDGGPGDDRFVSPGSLALLNGGPGLDSLEFDLSQQAAIEGLSFSITDSAFALTLGALSQTVPLSSVDRVVLDLPAGNQTVEASAFSGILEANGGPGNDTLTGGSGEDFLRGGAGNDTLTGNGSFDWLNGGAEDDVLQARDGSIDRGICGSGSDTAVADAVDSLSECETVSLPTGPPDTTPPDTTGLIGPKKVVKGKTATFRFSSTEPGGTFTCRIDKGKPQACSSPFKLSTGKLKPGRHTLIVAAVDAAGNVDRTPASVSFTVTEKKHHKRK